MSVVFLVRHGEAAASWDQDRDPGLSELGWKQALNVKAHFGDQASSPLFSSPLRRARETAMPLAEQWGRAVALQPAFAEIPAPPALDLEQRLQWLLALRGQGWGSADAELLGWRERILTTLKELPDQSIVFTHFMVMNTAVGHALGKDEYVCYQPANGSILTLQQTESCLQIMDLGRESASKVL